MFLIVKEDSCTREISEHFTSSNQAV